MKDLRSRFDVLATAAEGATRDFQELDDAIRSFASELSAAAEDARNAFAGGDKGAGGASGSVKVASDTSGIGSLTQSMQALPAMAGMIGGQVSSAIAGAFQPLYGIGQTLTAIMNQMSGTLTTFARRVDAAMKFQAVSGFLDSLKSKITSSIGQASQVAAQDMNGLQRAVMRLGPAALTSISAFNAFRNVRSYLSSVGDVAGKSLSRLTGINFSAAVGSANNFAFSITNINKAARVASSGMAAFGRNALAALGFTAVTYKAVGFLESGIKGASDLNETVSKTQAIMGNAAPAATAFADGLVKEFGLVKKDVLEAEAAFAGLGKGLGKLAGGDLSNFSNKFTQLAADLVSYNNMDFGQATNALQTALAGNQSDELKKLGVILLDDAVKARAVAEGFAKSTKEVSESAKIQARALMISEQLADASGDLARTASSPANVFRKMSGTLEGLATSVGQVILPVLSYAAKQFTEFASRVKTAFESNTPLINSMRTALYTFVGSIETGLSRAGETFQAIGDSISSAFSDEQKAGAEAFGTSIVDTVGSWVNGVGSFIRNIPEYFQIAVLKAGEFLNILQTNLDTIGAWISNNWVKVIADAIMAAGTAFGVGSARLTDALGRFMANPFDGFHVDFSDLLKDFKATTEQFPGIIKPDLAKSEQEIDRLWAKIQKNDEAFRNRVAGQVAEAGAVGPAGGMGAFKQPATEPEAKADKRGKIETAGAFELGSKEAYSAIVKAMNGTGKDRATDTIAKNSNRQVDALLDIARGVNRIANLDKGGSSIVFNSAPG